MIDLLWAEAARLEDLPPEEMKNAAEAKKITGHLNKVRVFKEVYRLNGLVKIILAINLTYHLKRAEYFSKFNWRGIKKERIKSLEASWTRRLLRD